MAVLTRTRSRFAVGLCWLALSAIGVDAQENTLAHAKTLYQTAAYDEALSVLDKLPIDASLADASEIEGYRVFCLLALGRNDEARQMIEAIVQRDPTYQPSDAQVSPRIVAVFSEVRRQLLPQILQKRYQEAKATFDRKEFPAASEQFKTVLSLLDDPALLGMQTRTDLRTVIMGFLDLSQLATPRPPASPSSSAAPQPVSPPKAPAPSPIYSADDADVAPPVVVSRKLPIWRPSGSQQRQEYVGTLLLVIDEEGNVTSATVLKGVHPTFDPSLVKAARDWKFQPGLKQGMPVKYRYAMGIRLQPASPTEILDAPSPR